MPSEVRDLDDFQKLDGRQREIMRKGESSLYADQKRKDVSSSTHKLGLGEHISRAGPMLQCEEVMTEYGT